MKISSTNILFSGEMLSMLHCHLKFLISEFIKVHDFPFLLSLLAQSFEDHHV